MILYNLHTIGAINQDGKIEITIHPAPKPEMKEVWPYEDAANLFTMLQNYFPTKTVNLMRGAFLSEATNEEIIRELKKRL